MRSLLGSLAFALAVAPLQCSTAFETSEADITTPTTLAESGAQAERPVSLAQTSWSRAKVPFPGTQSSWGNTLRVVLAALLFFSAIFAYSGLPHLSQEPLMSFEPPRRLASHFMQSLSSGMASSKTISEAARRNVALLHVRGLRHRLARLDVGDDGLLDDDRDSAMIQGYMARAEAYAQRQQFEKAATLFKKGVSMAKDMLDDLNKDHSGKVELDDAQHQLSSVVSRFAAFHLERGQAIAAKKVLRRIAPVIANRTDAVAMRCRLLAANALRDAGEMDEALAAYDALLVKTQAETERASLSEPEHAMLDEFAVEARGQHARALLSQGKVAEARQALEEELEKLTPSGVKLVHGQSALVLAVRLKAWLAVADLKEGYPMKAIELLDTSLASLGELPAGLAAATPEIQEMLQTRAMAKAQLGRLHSASEDLEVVRGLQDELKKTIVDGHNPDYEASSYEDNPDPRLWASMARTRAIAADLKLQSKSPDEALSLARDARNLLRDVKRSQGRLPKGYSLATFAEVKAIMAKAQSAKSASNFLAKRKEDEDSGLDDDIEEVKVDSGAEESLSDKWVPATFRENGLKQEHVGGKVVIEKLKEPEFHLEDDVVNRMQTSVTLKKRS